MSDQKSEKRADDASRRRARRRRDPLREEVPDEEVRRGNPPEPGITDPRREGNSTLTDPLERRII
jgi:hypothetical protein